VVDLDALTAKFPDADPIAGYRALVAKGKTDFIWQGQRFQVGQDPKGLSAPQPLMTLDRVPGQNAPESWNELLDKDLGARERRIVYEGYVKENLPLWQYQDRGAKESLAASIRPSYNMTDEDFAHFNALPQEQRDWVKKETLAFQEHQKERLKNVAGGLGYGFLGASAEDRLEVMSGWMQRGPGDPFVEQVVKGWLLPELGAESQALWAQGEVMRDQNMMMETLGRVETSYDQPTASRTIGMLEGLREGYAQEEDVFGKGRRGSEPAAELLGLIALQTEAAMKEAGLDYVELRGMPVVHSRSKDKFGDVDTRKAEKNRAIRSENRVKLSAELEELRANDGDSKRIAKLERRIAAIDERDAKGARTYGEGREAISFDDLLDRTLGYQKQLLTAKYGEEAAAMVMASSEMLEITLKNGLELLGQVDPTVFDSSGVKRDGVSWGDVLDQIALVGEGKVNSGDEMRGRVSLPNIFFDGLLWLNRRAASGITAALGDSDAYLYMMPDGTVWKDPIQVARYVEQQMKSDPEKYVWMEDFELSSSIGDAFRSYDGKEPIKPTIIPGDMAMLVESEEYAKRIEDRTIFGALMSRFSSGLAPDDTIGRAVAGTGAVAGDLLLDPINFVGSGVAMAGKSLGRYGKLAKNVQKAGVAVPDEVAKIPGVTSIDDIVAETNGVTRKELSKLSQREVVKYADGTPMANWMVPKKTLLQRFFGGAEGLADEAATSMATGFKNNPTYFDDLAEALTKDEVFRMRNHSWWSAAGVAGDVDQAAAIMRAHLPTFKRILTSTDDITYLEKAQKHFRSMATGRPEAAMERAKGIFIGRYLGTPIATDAIAGLLNRGEKVVGAAVKLMPDREYKWMNHARALRDNVKNARLRARSSVRFDTVYSKEGGSYKMPHSIVEALRHAQRGHASNQATAERIVHGWVFDDTLKMAPDRLYSEINSILEMGGELNDAALREVVLIEKLQASVKAGGFSPHMPHSQVAQEYKALREAITPEEMAVVRKRWEPHMNMVANKKAADDWMAAQGESMGLFLAEENYAEHLLRPHKSMGKTPGSYFTPNGVINELGAVKLRDTLSRHNLERTGPPTLSEAIAYGFRPVMDARVSHLGRVSSFMDDISQAEALRTIAHEQGKVLPRNQATLQAVMGDKASIVGVDSERAATQFLKEAQAKAVGMEQGYKGIKSTLDKVRRKQSNLDKALKKRGLTADDVTDNPVPKPDAGSTVYKDKLWGSEEYTDPVTKQHAGFGDRFLKEEYDLAEPWKYTRGEFFQAIRDNKKFVLPPDILRDTSLMERNRPGLAHIRTEKNLARPQEHLDVLKRSIADDGFRVDRAVSVFFRDGRFGISDGTHRVYVAGEAGVDAIPVDLLWSDIKDMPQAGHEMLVEAALKRGKQLPAAVIAEYPHLLKKYKNAKIAPDPKELNLLHNEVESLRVAHREAVKDFATEYGLNAEYQARLLEHSTVGGQEAKYRYMNLKKKLKTAEDPDVIAMLEAELRQVEPIREQYLTAHHRLRDAGMTDGDIAGVVFETYGQPTLWHLTPAEMQAFVDDGLVNLKHTLDYIEKDGVKYFDDIGEAAAAYKDAGRVEGETFVKWTPNDVQEIYKPLSNVYLPVETVLALKSRGFKIGKADQMGEVAMMGAFGKVIDWFNRFFKGNVTVYAPSLHFGRRNQMDAMSKAFYYSGLNAASPSLRAEFKAMRDGTVDYIMTGTGQKISTRQMMEEAGPLAQTFEQRVGVEGRLRPQIGSTAKEIAEEEAMVLADTKYVLQQSANAQAPGKFFGSPRTGAVGLRGSRTGEKLWPFGPQSAEVFDNQLKLWVYFMERKAGRSAKAARSNALDIGRDYTNTTGFQKWFIDRFPVMFANFHKQNLKSIKVLLEQGNYGRLAIPEKLLHAMEQDMPEDMRPEWMDTMTAIMGADAAWGLNRDLSGVNVLDPFATLINGMARGRGWVTNKQAFKQAAQGMTPIGQYALAPVVESLTGSEPFKSRLRLPQELQTAIYKRFGNMDNKLFSAGMVGGRATVQTTGWMDFLAGMSGIGAWNSTVNRHWDSVRSGNPWEMGIQLGGMAKKTSFRNKAFDKIRDVQEFTHEQLEAMWAIKEREDGSLTHAFDMSPEEYEAVEMIIGFSEGLHEQVMRNLYTLMRLSNPKKPLPKEENK